MTDIICRWRYKCAGVAAGIKISEAQA